MNKVTWTSSLLASAALFGSSAFAADISPAASSWTGFYFGAGGGGSFAFSNTEAAGYSSFEFDTEGDYNRTRDIVDSSGKVFGRYDIDCDTDDSNDDCDVDVDSAATIGGGQLPSAIVDIVGEDFINGLFDGESDTGIAGAVGTVELGGDYQVGNMFVVGLNGSFNFGNSSIENSAHGGVDADYYVEDDYAEADGDAVSKLDTELNLGNSWTVGARLGALLNDRNLLFVSGGYISSKAELSASYATFSSGEADEGSDDVEADVGFNVESSTDEWLHGYYIGGGMESMLTDHLSFRMEYRFADLGTIDTSVERVGVDSDNEARVEASAGVSAKANPLIHSVRATFNWRF